jgi:sulfate transport system substrate-binding protein
MRTEHAIATMVLAVALGACTSRSGGAAKRLLNVSYDPTRELYAEINAAFVKSWAEKTHETVTIDQSHGGSAKQARSVIDGLEADVVTLALAYDVDAIAERAKLIDPGWQSRLPFDSTPFASTVVLVVRKGNPKQIRDWGDVIREGVSVIAPNPKTSGGARWIYLAAWAYALEKNGGDDARAEAFVTELYAHVPVLDSGARGASTTFASRKLGDVLLAWENDAETTRREFLEDGFEIIVPSMSILAEPTVAIVDKVVERHGTRALARAYLEFLYSDEGQEIGAHNFFRPRKAEIAKRHEKEFPAVRWVTVKEKFGSWHEAQRRHFEDGGVFDRISRSARP